MKIILASTSPRRKEILSKTDLVFEIQPGLYEEDMTLNMDPISLAKHLSYHKAKSITDTHTDALIIGADTFITYEGKLLGKPHTPEKATEMLRTLSGKIHSVLTGLAVIRTSDGKVYSDVDESKIYFKDLSEDTIKKYVATGEPLDKAGAYAIQGLASEFIEKIEGDFFSVMGLPLQKLVQVLATEFGLNVNQIK